MAEDVLAVRLLVELEAPASLVQMRDAEHVAVARRLDLTSKKSDSVEAEITNKLSPQSFFISK